MLIAWSRWSWRWNQWQRRWPQHGILFCFCQLSDVGNGRWNSENNPYFFDLIVLTFVILEVLPRWWLFHRKPGYIYLLSTCVTVAGASISLERARKNSVYGLGGMWWRIGGSQSRSGHRWMTNGIAISIADGAAERLIFCCNFYCGSAPLMMFWLW